MTLVNNAPDPTMLEPLIRYLDAERATEFAPYEPETTLIDPLLDYLWHYQATDLHLCAGSTPRVRIDGHLVAVPEQPPLTAELLERIFGSLLSPKLTQAYQRDRQVDFAFWWGERARFRANAYYQLGKPSLALRLIPGDIPTPEQLGLPAVCGQLLTRPHGLVLMTGPTGSGKSTTLAAMIGWINRHRPLHILTIEDPIEYVHKSAASLVNQREVGSDCTSFAEGLKSALREDPDVVLVGEMRDLETIALTLTLAETGHLVFATLHTNDASQTVDRVIDVFPADQQNQIRTQFSMALAAVISQRLVRRVNGGRVAAYEILMGTAAVSNLIREGKVRQLRNIISTGQKDGMCVLEQSLGHLVTSGLISIDEARAASIYPEDIVGLGGAVHSQNGATHLQTAVHDPGIRL